MSICTKGYYIYAYIRNKDSDNGSAGTPYYIGKGKKYRAWEKHSCPIPKDKKYIIILEQNLTEVGALALERRLIKWYGRLDNRTGILHNKTDGGDSPPDMSGIPTGRKGEYWWNNGIEHKMSFDCPGPEYVRGRISDNWSDHKRGKQYWNNGHEVMLSIDCPGTGWVLGKLESMKHIYTDEDRANARERALKQRLKGQNALVGGTIQRERIANGTHQNCQIHTCPHCGKVGKGPAMLQHHFDRCKAITKCSGD